MPALSLQLMHSAARGNGLLETATGKLHSSDL